MLAFAKSLEELAAAIPLTMARARSKWDCEALAHGESSRVCTGGASLCDSVMLESSICCKENLSASARREWAGFHLCADLRLCQTEAILRTCQVCMAMICVGVDPSLALTRLCLGEEQWVQGTADRAKDWRMKPGMTGFCCDDVDVVIRG